MPTLPVRVKVRVLGTLCFIFRPLGLQTDNTVCLQGEKLSVGEHRSGQKNFQNTLKRYAAKNVSAVFLVDCLFILNTQRS